MRADARFWHEEVDPEPLLDARRRWLKILRHSVAVAAYVLTQFPDADLDNSWHLTFRDFPGEYVALAGGKLLRIEPIGAN
jgi:hypothetical protein